MTKLDKILNSEQLGNEALLDTVDGHIRLIKEALESGEKRGGTPDGDVQDEVATSFETLVELGLSEKNGDFQKLDEIAAEEFKREK